MKPYMFIKITNIQGESEDQNHEGWIDVLSWDWGCKQQVNIGAGSRGRSSQRGQVELFNFTKPIDRSSPAISYATLVGTHIDAAEFHMTKAGDAGQALDFVKFKLEGVLIADYKTGGGNGGDNTSMPIEHVSLAFNAVRYHYVVQTSMGGGGANPEMQWDIVSGRGSVA